MKRDPRKLPEYKNVVRARKDYDESYAKVGKAAHPAYPRSAGAN